MYKIEDRGYGFVSWKPRVAGEVEATIWDLWEIAQTIESEPFGRHCHFISIDQKSATDKTFVFVVLDYFSTKIARRRWAQIKYLPYPGLNGFTFCRIPAQDARVYLGKMHSYGNKSFHHNSKHILRPEWRPQDNLIDGDDNPVIFEGNHHTGPEDSVNETDSEKRYSDFETGES